MTGDLTARLRALEQGSDPTAALAFYDSLPAATLDQMTGSWRGAGLPTGHVFDGLLEQFGWHGKRFDSSEEAHPLVFAKADGTLFSINPARIPMGMLVDHIELARSPAASGFFRVSSAMLATEKPQARLRLTDYRGVVTATMIYDALPINDVFRSVTPDLLVGAMDMRGFDRPFLFTLRRETPAAARQSEPPGDRTMSEPEFVIVTGAGSGIGRELTRLFLQDGAHVLGVSLVPDELTALEAEMAGLSGTLVTRAQDLSKLDAAEELLAACDAQGWSVDTLVNNAGFATFGDVTDTDLARIQTMLQLNVITVMKLSALFGARMKARGKGDILNVGSTAGMVPSARFAAYGASKAFVNSFSYAFREEMRPYGVNVTCLTPGPVQTKFADTAQIDTFEGKSMVKQWFESGNVSTAAEVAREGYDGLRAGKGQVLAGTGSTLAALAMHLLPPSLIPRLVKDA